MFVVEKGDISKVMWKKKKKTRVHCLSGINNDPIVRIAGIDRTWCQCTGTNNFWHGFPSS